MEVPTLRDESCSSSPSASLSVPPSLPGASSSVPPASHASQETNDDMEEDQPMQPLKFFFSQTEYGKTCKISTRCDIVNTRETIDSLQLSVSGKRWFRRHPQFKHIWHMDRDRVCKVMGFWMLFLRTASTEKSRVCWFVVNGVPIRYSMREHALISGLNCHEYPPRYKQLGSFSFVKRIFGRTKKISIKDVEKKLKDMEDEDTCQDDLLKLAVLYFLAKVIRGKKKIIKGSIDRFILRIVDDLDACKTFPWGRLTFEDNIKAIFHMIGHFNGKVKSSWGFPGFIVPLEVLAFECIPNLGKKFYEVVSDANDGCPRMCKHRLKATGMKGFPLEDIYEALGKTKDILSILEPFCAEQDLLLRIMERDEDGRDSIDPIADCWNERLDLQQKKIWWENLYKLDIASREENVSPAEQSNQQERSFPPAEQMSQQEGKNISRKKYLDLMANGDFQEEKWRTKNKRMKREKVCVL